jgi:hypothetical protein
MIFDPDEPRSQARTPRQSLIRTERGWAVIGQPTEAAERWVKEHRDELAALVPGRNADLEASRMAHRLVSEGKLR